MNDTSKEKEKQSANSSSKKEGSKLGLHAEKLPFKFILNYRKARSYSSDRRASSFIRSMESPKKEVCLTIESSVCSIQGKRPKMEDTNMIVPSMEALGLSGDSTSVEKSQSEGSGVRSRPRGQPTLPFGFFGVYDGHGGDKASEYVCENLHLQFLECANKMGDLSRVEELEESLRAAILKVEEKWLLHAEEIENCSGTTAAVVVVKDLNLIVGNVGDSEIIICGKDGKAITLTEVHNPKRNKSEGERIIQEGGVLFHDRVGHPVIHPSFLSIAVSRAIGDWGFKSLNFTKGKPSGIIPDPYITHLTLRPNDHRFAVLACDGVWDVMSGQEVADFVIKKLNEKTRVDEVVTELVNEAERKGSLDNITAVLLHFDWSDRTIG